MVTTTTAREWESRDAARALVVARRFLGRWSDSWTRSSRDDLAQEVAMEVLRRRATLRRRDRLDAFVRTICRRSRGRALTRHLRHELLSLDADDRDEELVMEERQPPTVRVGGRRVTLDWCLDELTPLLRRLGSLNAKLLLDYYEGFSCGELAERYGMPAEVVKVRLHRSRQRIRRAFEVRLRASEPPASGSG